MSEKIIISMTSYPKRIGNVAKAIFLSLTKQTKKPDEIHLWLAEPEFPNKEKDLPEDLATIITTVPNVFLHWLPKNTYCHKRHEIFKYTNNDACVFFFDDDVRYDDKLIELVMIKHNEFPNAVINYEHYAQHIYNGKHIIYKNLNDYSKPRLDVRWCGQSMIPANVYPKETLDEEHQKIRDEICPICDESWFTPWLVHHDIPIYCMHFGWGKNISPQVNMWHGLCASTHEKESNGYERRDNWLYAVLQTYPVILEKYKNMFKYEDQ